MYEPFFGLKELPFTLTPDTGFLYRHSRQQCVVNELLMGLKSGEGFLSVVAEVGSGKTLLCRELLELLPVDWVSVYLPNPLLTSAELYLHIARELSISDKHGHTLTEIQQQIFERLVEIHAAGGQTVILLDEAQAMPQQTLEALRLLSNLETEKNKLLQVVFFAQPEFEKRLTQHNLRQLQQRITFTFYLDPISLDEVDGYLTHRLSKAGYNGPRLFSSAAMHKIWRSSGGCPRLINILAHKSMLVAYGRGERKISTSQVRAAIADTASIASGGVFGSSLVPFGVGLCSTLALALVFIFLLRGPG
ncbi:ExeA family protein [Geopsychrobacter electrodiphilus]|uniref:ExeA family protein n=1 Tax=Geopsychrobacter electrodiphilus TaxID=225196 RepID=UPI00037C85DC|nr:AAA family ATPase [Geopsychrobacter electrodiphilus]